MTKFNILETLKNASKQSEFQPHFIMSNLNVRRSNRVCEIDYELGELFDVDDVLGVLGVGVDDLGTPRHLDFK